jgi:hypothetical protein
MSVTMATIRAAYPNPVTLTEGQDDPCAYCVGGAAVRWLEDHGVLPTWDDLIMIGDASTPRFPSSTYLARVLQVLNPTLTEPQALRYADEVVDSNDDLSTGMAAAWASLDDALEVHDDRL